MWVRFWYKSSCVSKEESIYQWQESESVDGLEDYAPEIVPKWAQEGYSSSYGFERIDRPPLEELEKLLDQYAHASVHANDMLQFLMKEIRATKARVPKDDPGI